MISEEQQDQAALHVLGLLSAAEAAAFESALSASAELRDFVRELREAAAYVALSAPSQAPPASLKQRIMREITTAKSRPPRDLYNALRLAGSLGHRGGVDRVLRGARS